MRKERAEEQAEVKALAASYESAVEQAQAQHAAALRAVQQRQQVQLTALQEQLKAQVRAWVAFAPPVGYYGQGCVGCQGLRLWRTCKQQKAREAAATTGPPALFLCALCSATVALRYRRLWCLVCVPSLPESIELCACCEQAVSAAAEMGHQGQLQLSGLHPGCLLVQCAA